MAVAGRRELPRRGALGDHHARRVGSGGQAEVEPCRVQAAGAGVDDSTGEGVRADLVGEACPIDVPHVLAEVVVMLGGEVAQVGEDTVGVG